MAFLSVEHDKCVSKINYSGCVFNSFKAIFFYQHSLFNIYDCSFTSEVACSNFVRITNIFSQQYAINERQFSSHYHNSSQSRKLVFYFIFREAFADD